MPKTTEFVKFKLLMMPCCGTHICWVNPRYPTHCPECGELVYPAIKNPEHCLHSDDSARLVLGAALPKGVPA